MGSSLHNWIYERTPYTHVVHFPRGLPGWRPRDIRIASGPLTEGTNVANAANASTRFPLPLLRVYFADANDGITY